MKRPTVLAATATAALVVGLMPALPATAATGQVTGSTRWVNNDVTILYSWDGLGAAGQPATLTLNVDGKQLLTDRSPRTDRLITVPRKTGKRITITATTQTCTITPVPTASTTITPSAQPTDTASTLPAQPTAATPTPTATPTQTCSTTTLWTSTATHRTIKPTAQQASALALLNKLKVAKESHSSSYARSQFKLWVDANRDGENTRAEVLKSESKTRVVINRNGTVKTGKWISAYDGKTITVGSKLDIDHLVPLAEAWASGGYRWSTKQRTAYANDLGYGASLIAVSQHENRAKGDDDPSEYLPPKTSYRCTYVRNWIAVKSRWGLSVDSAEKAALRVDLARYCASPYVAKPGKPNLTALVGAPKPVVKPKPKPKPKPVSGGSVYYANCAAVRAAGKAPLYAGEPGYATPRLDRDGDGVACE